MTTQGIIQKSKVEMLCTTDSPLDNLRYHEACAEQNLPFSVLPTFRPDDFFAIEKAAEWKATLAKLQEVTDRSIDTYGDLISALESRMDYFHDRGCRLSDHGFEAIFSGNYDAEAATKAFEKLKNDGTPDDYGASNFKTHLLFSLCVAYAERGWTQQFHLGLSETPIRES